MADSIPSLRRKLDEALAKIGRLEGQLADVPEPVVKTVYVDREVRVPGPENIVYVDREVRVPGPEKIVYVDKEVASPPEVRTEYIYVDKPVPGPERIVYVDREVRVPAKPEIVEVERVVNVPVPFKVTERVIEYHDNPEHLRMIAELQGRLQAWQAISQSDS